MLLEKERDLLYREKEMETNIRECRALTSRLESREREVQQKMVVVQAQESALQDKQNIHTLSCQSENDKTKIRKFKHFRIA